MRTLRHVHGVIKPQIKAILCHEEVANAMALLTISSRLVLDKSTLLSQLTAHGSRFRAYVAPIFTPLDHKP